MAGADGGTPGLAVRRVRDGAVSGHLATGANRTAGMGSPLAAYPGAGGPGRLVEFVGHRRFPGGRRHRRRLVRLVGGPPGARAGPDAEHPDVCPVQRPGWIRGSAVADRAGAVRGGPGHGRRVVAGRGPGDGGLGRPVPGPVGGPDRRRRQRRLPHRRASQPRPRFIPRRAVDVGTARFVGPMAVANGAGDVAGPADVFHPDVRPRIGRLGTRARQGQDVGLVRPRPARRPGRRLGLLGDSVALEPAGELAAAGQRHALRAPRRDPGLSLSDLPLPGPGRGNDRRNQGHHSHDAPGRRPERRPVAGDLGVGPMGADLGGSSCPGGCRRPRE